MPLPNRSLSTVLVSHSRRTPSTKIMLRQGAHTHTRTNLFLPCSTFLLYWIQLQSCTRVHSTRRVRLALPSVASPRLVCGSLPRRLPPPPLPCPSAAHLHCRAKARHEFRSHQKETDPERVRASQAMQLYSTLCHTVLYCSSQDNTCSIWYA